MKGFGRLGVKTAAFYVSTSFVSILLGLARVMGVQLGFGGHFFVVVAPLLTSIGLAGIPSASLMAILLILKSSGIPGAEIAVVALLAVDRLLEMSRTAASIYSDSCSS